MNDICAALFSTHICAGIAKMKLAFLNKKRSDNISGGLGIQENRNTILERKNYFYASLTGCQVYTLIVVYYYNVLRSFIV